MNNKEKKEIVVHNTIVHYLNKESSTTLLADYEDKSNVELTKDFKKVFKSVSRNKFTRKAKFVDFKNNRLRELAEEMMFDSSKFVENSKEIANLLYDVMMLDDTIPSGCLAIGLFSEDSEKKVGIFNIGFKKSYANKLDVSNDKIDFKIVKKDDLIPESMTTNQSAIISLSGMNDEFHLHVLDKKAEKDKLDSNFINKFLSAEKIQDDLYVMKTFKETLDTFIQNNYVDDLKEGENVKSLFNNIIKTSETFNPQEILDELFDNDEERKEIITEVLEEKIDDLAKEVEVDDEWVNKELKARTIKTDTGFTLKGDLIDLDDPMKYSLKENADGSVDIVIKNVKIFM